VKFERYAFDLSRFAGGPQLQAFGVRERNLWDVAFPEPTIPPTSNADAFPRRAA
jgi:hypothetical protein